MKDVYLIMSGWSALNLIFHSSEESKLKSRNWTHHTLWVILSCWKLVCHWEQLYRGCWEVIMFTESIKLNLNVHHVYYGTLTWNRKMVNSKIISSKNTTQRNIYNNSLRNKNLVCQKFDGIEMENVVQFPLYKSIWLDG